MCVCFADVYSTDPAVSCVLKHALFTSSLLGLQTPSSTPPPSAHLTRPPLLSAVYVPPNQTHHPPTSYSRAEYACYVNTHHGNVGGEREREGEGEKRRGARERNRVCVCVCLQEESLWGLALCSAGVSWLVACRLMCVCVCVCVCTRICARCKQRRPHKHP